MVGRTLELVLPVLLVGCGRIDFDTHDAGPISIRIGERPGATSLGTTDTFLDSLLPTTAHGGENGMQCDPPDFTMIRFELPAGVPASVISAELHIGVTTDRLETGVVEVYEMLLDWTELEATWKERKIGVAWPIAGAGGSARAATPFATFDGRVLFTDYTVAVPTDVMLRWWSGANFGFGMRVTLSAGVNIGPHESELPELRPELDVTYQP